MFEKYLHAGDEQLIVSVPILWLAVVALMSLIFIIILPSAVLWFSLRSSLSGNEENYAPAQVDHAAAVRRRERRSPISNKDAAAVAAAGPSAADLPAGATDSERPYPATGRRRGTSLFKKTSDSFRQVLSFALGGSRSRQAAGAAASPRPKSSRSPVTGVDVSPSAKNPSTPSSPPSKQAFVGAEWYKVRKTTVPTAAPEMGPNASSPSEWPGQ